MFNFDPKIEGRNVSQNADNFEFEMWVNTIKSSDS